LKKRAVLIVGHGSRLKGSQKSIEQLVNRLKDDRRFPIVYGAYLSYRLPSIPAAVDRCVREGADEILILPYFLSIGSHVKSDIPRLVSLAQKKYGQKTKIRLSPYLGYHEKIVAVVKERLEAAR